MPMPHYSSTMKPRVAVPFYSVHSICSEEKTIVVIVAVPNKITIWYSIVQTPARISSAEPVTASHASITSYGLSLHVCLFSIHVCLLQYILQSSFF